MCASKVRPILAVDLDKYKSVACIYGCESGEAIFRSVRGIRDHARCGRGQTHPSTNRSRSPYDNCCSIDRVLATDN